MFALVNGQELLLGPIAFNYRLINSSLEEDLELDYRVKSSDYSQVPIQITEEVKILSTKDEIPDFDERFEIVRLSYHEITDNEVIFYYTKIEKTLEEIKEERKKEVSPKRWNRENATISVIINGTEIKASTSRENRLALVTKLLSGDGPYNFKFDTNIWLEITKEDLQNLITQIDLKVQEAFDWELAKLTEIDACETKESVYEVDISDPVSLNPANA
jgi:hypothetical protein